MKVGMRKFTLTVLAMVCFTGVMIMSRFSIAPVDLGMGIALLLAGPMASYMSEYLSKKQG